jgi:hypothetical protein
LSLAVLLVGCSGSPSDDSAAAASQADEQDLTTASVSKLPASQSLHNPAFDSMRSLYAKTTYEYQDIQDTSAFSFKASASMSDADALATAKAIAKSAGYNEVHAYTLNAAGTPKRLARLANTLATQIRASGDDANSPKLEAAMVRAFALPGKTPGGSIKVFTAVGPGDDHDFDNQDREAIFLDVAEGQALVLQGQSIDM